MSNTEKHFSIHNIYVKDISFESPRTPQVFNKTWKPKLDFDIKLNTESLGDNVHEVILNLNLNIKLAKDDSKDPQTLKDDEFESVCIIEVQQAGVFTISGLTDEELEIIRSIRAPEILFPYAREAVANLMTRGGFPQLLLPPVNFEAMYHEHAKKNQAEEASA